MIRRPLSPASRSPRDLFAEARRAVNPTATQQARIRSVLHRRITAPPVLQEAQESLRPTSARQTRVWLAVRSMVSGSLTGSLWDRLRDQFTPSNALSARLWQRILPGLVPVIVPSGTQRYGYRTIKLVSAFAVLLIVVRLSPVLFFAPPTVAESSVSVTLTRGSAAILRDGLWQPIQGEIALQDEAIIRTDEGEVTITDHDDAVVRLAPHTTITLYDLSDRPSDTPGRATTLALNEGQIWVQGFLPRPLEALHIGTDQAQVDVQEGSVSITQRNDIVTVETWDRSAAVIRRSKITSVVAGEQLVVHDGNLSLVHLEPSRYHEAWVSSNLARDAVHQHEIAQMQQERHAAEAGILPDSSLYPAKRFAEAVDVLLTFTPEGRAQKLISHANNRLNEAAALIARGSGSDASLSLQEYKDTLLAVASGSGGSTVVRSLLQQEVVEKATAETSAALPNDDLYALKETVRQAIAELPQSGENSEEIRAAEILDQLSTVRQSVSEGSVTPAQMEALTSLVRGSNAGTLTPSALREVRANLSTIVAAVHDQTVLDEEEDAPSETEAPRVRERGAPSPRPPLSEAEVQERVQQILGHINVFEQPRSRRNTLVEEMRSLERDPDQGAILRALSEKDLNEGLLRLVEHQIQELSAQTRETLDTKQQDGTGSALPQAD